MKRIFLRLKQPLRNERGEITFFACFFVVGIVMLISFLLLYASIRITCINIRNGAKMELNNLTRALASLAASGHFHTLGTVGSFDPASPLYAAG